MQLEPHAVVAVHPRRCHVPAVPGRGRGRGLLQGLVLAAPGAALVGIMQERGFLINCTAGNVLRFAPPYIISSADIARLLAALDAVLAGWQPPS